MACPRDDVGPGEVDLEDSTPGVRGDVGCLSAEHDPGAVDESVDASEALGHLFHHGCDAALVDDVDGEAGRSRCFRGLLESVGVAVEKGKGGSFSGEQLGYRATNPPSGAGDDHTPSMESASGGVDPGVIGCA